MLGRHVLTGATDIPPAASPALRPRISSHFQLFWGYNPRKSSGPLTPAMPPKTSTNRSSRNAPYPDRFLFQSASRFLVKSVSRFPPPPLGRAEG